MTNVLVLVSFLSFLCVFSRLFLVFFRRIRRFASLHSSLSVFVLFFVLTEDRKKKRFRDEIFYFEERREKKIHSFIHSFIRDNATKRRARAKERERHADKTREREREGRRFFSSNNTNNNCCLFCVRILRGPEREGEREDILSPLLKERENRD